MFASRIFPVIVKIACFLTNLMTTILCCWNFGIYVCSYLLSGLVRSFSEIYVENVLNKSSLSTIKIHPLRIIDRYRDVKSNFYLCVTNFGVLKKTDDNFFANNNSLIPVF